MQENQFTQASLNVLQAAHQLALDRQHAAVSEDHLLAALLKEDKHVLPHLLAQDQVEVTALLPIIEKQLDHQAKVKGSTPQLTAGVSTLLQQSYQYAQKRGMNKLHHNYPVIDNHSRKRHYPKKTQYAQCIP